MLYLLIILAALAINYWFQNPSPGSVSPLVEYAHPFRHECSLACSPNKSKHLHYKVPPGTPILSPVNGVAIYNRQLDCYDIYTGGDVTLRLYTGILTCKVPGEISIGQEIGYTDIHPVGDQVDFIIAVLHNDHVVNPLTKIDSQNIKFQS